MKVGFFSRKNYGKRISLIPDNEDDKLLISTCFAHKKITKTGSVSFPYSRRSLAEIEESVGTDYELTLKAKVPVAILKGRMIMVDGMREVCAKAQKDHLQSFIDSGYNPDQPAELPMEMDPILTPRSHQRAALNYMIDIMEERKSFYLYLDMGLGKTILALIFVEYLIEMGLIRNAIVFAPLTTMKSSWADDIEKATGLISSILYSTKNGIYKERDLSEKLKKKAHVYVTNYGTLRSEKYMGMISEANSYDCIVVDESSKIKGHKTVGYRRLLNFANDNDIDYKFFLSGTPAPRSVTDLWSQFFLGDDGLVLGESFKEFEEEHTSLIGNSKHFRMHKKDAHLNVHETIKPYIISFKKEDVLDLDPRSHILRLIDIDPGAMHIYNEMVKEGVVSYNEVTKDGENMTGFIEKTNILTRMQAFRQITGGFLYKDGDDRKVDSPLRFPSKKNDVALEIVESIMSQNSSDKVIIWGTFRYEMKRLVDLLGDNKIKVASAFGGMNPSATLASLEKFNKDKDCRVLVASRASIGTGTNLQVANYAIYYSLDENLEQYLQSLDRIYRIGQKKKVFNYYLIGRETYDERLVTILRKKQTLQDYLVQGKKLTRNRLRNSAILKEWRIED